MPHLVVEATPRLAVLMDWDEVLCAIHAALEGQGFAAEHTIKSRVHLTSYARSGQDAGAEQLVARLTMTRRRPEEQQAAMARLVHEYLCEAIAHARPSSWVQCCVLHETVPSGNYLLRQWNAASTSA